MMQAGKPPAADMTQMTDYADISDIADFLEMVLFRYWISLTREKI
jgi:hypothetical protein